MDNDQPASKRMTIFFCGLSKIDRVYIGQAGSMFCPQDRSGSQESPVSSSKFLEDGQSRYKGLASVKKKRTLLSIAILHRKILYDYVEFSSSQSQKKYTSVDPKQM